MKKSKDDVRQQKIIKLFFSACQLISTLCGKLLRANNFFVNTIYDRFLLNLRNNLMQKSCLSNTCVDMFVLELC